MRIPKYVPYEEPAPRRRWTREEIMAAVACVRAMAADEAAGADPRRLERTKNLAGALGRELQTVRLRLANVAHVLVAAGLPVPACVRPMPGVGTRIAAAMLDAWHELDAAGDLATSGPVQARRPWTVEDLSEALSACKRMAATETRLGRALTLDEAGDRICDLAAQLGRRWSETRHVAAALADAMAGTAPACLQEAEPAVLGEAEREELERLLQGQTG